MPSLFTLVKNGAKLSSAGHYEGTENKSESVTLANKAQLENAQFVFQDIDKVTGSKFNEQVTLLTAPLKNGTIDLGKGTDELTIENGEYKLTIKNGSVRIGC